MRPASWLCRVLGLVGMVYGFLRLFSASFEQYRFIAVLGLDDGFLTLFGALECILGLLLFSQKDQNGVLLTLTCSGLLHTALMVAALSMLGSSAGGGILIGVGNLYSITFSSANIVEEDVDTVRAAHRSIAWLGLYLLAGVIEWSDRPSQR